MGYFETLKIWQQRLYLNAENSLLPEKERKKGDKQRESERARASLSSAFSGCTQEGRQEKGHGGLCLDGFGFAKGPGRQEACTPLSIPQARAV